MNIRQASAVATTLLFAAASAFGADIVKAANTNAVNLGTSWVGGVAPGAGDVALWNNTISAGNSSPLSADVSWGGIKVTNVGGTQNNSAGVNSLQVTGSGNTLTLGTSGIDLSAATQAIQLQSRILLGGNQTWNVANANTNATVFGGGFSEDVYFNAQSSNLPMNLGGFSVSTSGAGSIAITSGFTISNGTINVGNAGGLLTQSGGSRITTLAANLTINVAAGSRLRMQANSSPTNGSGTTEGGLALDSSAAININGGTLEFTSAGNNQNNRLDQKGKLSFTGTSVVTNLMTSVFRTNIIGEVAFSGTTNWTESGSTTAPTTISGNITGNGTVNYRGTSSGHNLLLSGDNSAFTGTINLDGSSGNRILRLTTASAGSASATWVPSAANTVQVDGVAVNLGTLNGAGTVTNSHASNVAAITVGAGTFSGVISNGAPADGMSLTKNTAGTLILSGANTYTGLTNIQAGTLATTTAQTGGGAVTVADSATLGVTQISGGDTFNVSTLTLGSAGGSTLEVTPAASPSVALLTTVDLNVNGPTTLRVKGTPVAGTELVSYSTLGGSSGFAGLNLVMPFRINGTLSNVGSAIVLATVQNETPKWRNGDGVWDINTTGNWKTSATSTTTNYLEGGAGATDSVIFDDTASGVSPITVTLNSTVSPVAMTVNNSTKAYTISGSGSIAGTGGLVKDGGAALTLATSNSFSGGVQLFAGTLNVDHASALGSGTLTIEDGTTLGNSSGSAITASPAVAQIWNGSFTFAGPSDLNLGGAVTLTTSPTVTVSAGNFTVGGISGTAFGLNKDGPGTLTIGAGTYTGPTYIDAGTLRAGAVGAFNSSPIVLSDVAGVTLDLNGFNQTINSIDGGGTTGGDVVLGGGTLTTSSAGTIGALSGTGGFVKNGASTFTIAGLTSGYTGNTTINGGVLDVGTLGGAFGATLNIGNSGAILQANGNITGSVGTGNQIVCGNGGFAARGGNLTLNFHGDGRLINLSSGGNVFGNSFVFGSPTADSKVIVQNDIGINNNGGTRSFTVNPGTGTDSAEFTGVISPGAAGGVSGLLKFGAGNLILSNANTYIGITTINGGRITLGHAQALQFSALNTDSAGKLTVSGFATPTFGGLTGAGNLATIVDTGYGDITTLTLSPQGTQSRTYTGVIADGATGMNLVKSGTGTQALNGANTYTGNTTVLAGTLRLGDGSLNSSLADSSTISVAASATLELNFLPANTDTVDKLFLGGTQVAAGIWGSVASGAPNTSPQLTGTGTLTVTTGPAGFSGWIAGSFGGGSVPGGQQGPGADPDADGIPNLVEYAVDGLDPTLPNAPIGTFDGATLSFSKRALAVSNGDVTYAIEESDDLGLLDTWAEAVAGPNYTNNPTTISYTLPTGVGSIFARLRVQSAP